MKNCLKKLLHQAYQQWRIGDKFVKSSYDIYVESLVRHSKGKSDYSEAMDYWNTLKKEEWKE